MITGGYSDKLLKSLLIFTLLILPSIVFSNKLDVISSSNQITGVPPEKDIIDDRNSIHPADNSPITLEFDTQISFRLDSIADKRSYRINTNWSI